MTFLFDELTQLIINFRSRLEIQKTRSEKNEEIREQEVEMRNLREDLANLEADINRNGY